MWYNRSRQSWPCPGTSGSHNPVHPAGGPAFRRRQGEKASRTGPSKMRPFPFFRKSGLRPIRRRPGGARRSCRDFRPFEAIRRPENDKEGEPCAKTPSFCTATSTIFTPRSNVCSPRNFPKSPWPWRAIPKSGTASFWPRTIWPRPPACRRPSPFFRPGKSVPGWCWSRPGTTNT